MYCPKQTPNPVLDLRIGSETRVFFSVFDSVSCLTNTTFETEKQIINLEKLSVSPLKQKFLSVSSFYIYRSFRNPSSLPVITALSIFKALAFKILISAGIIFPALKYGLLIIFSLNIIHQPNNHDISHHDILTIDVSFNAIPNHVRFFGNQVFEGGHHPQSLPLLPK